MARQTRVFPLLWAAAWPLRQYLRHSPVPRGKGLLVRRILTPLLPPAPESFLAALPGGGVIRLQYREALGRTTLLDGGFETKEVVTLCLYARSGTAAIDAGAHIGTFTIPLAHAVAPDGIVIAVEPFAANADRLSEHLELNKSRNVRLCRVALGDREGETILHLADDSAFASTDTVLFGHGTGQRTVVPTTRLDSLWSEAGEPSVSAVKIDVEGGELAVLRGGERMLAACRPVLLVEAYDEEHLSALASWLSQRGFRERTPPGFMPWNHLFLSEGQPDG